MNRDTITVKQRKLLSLNRFRYECMDEESKWEWYRIKDEKGHARMMRLLDSAYVKPSLIIRAMQDGQIGRTVFTRFRAIRLDSE
jgi:hypothetical protein